MSDTAEFLLRISPPEASPVIIYDGPMPASAATLDPYWDPANAYVYMLLEDSWALYIGMSNYTRRWRDHKSRPWFSNADQLIVLQLTGSRRLHARDAALKTEREAIRMFGPKHNIAGVGVL